MFFKDVDIGKVLLSKKISSGEKNCKQYTIGYLYDHYKVNLLHIILPKERTYVNSYDGKTKWMYFLKIKTYQKYVILFWINSELEQKRI